MAASDNKQEETQGKQPQVVLIAYLQAHLVSGETFDLLPIRHENDVKSEVTKLLEQWADSGFLLRGNLAYPWHQVRLVEVTRIEELSPQEVHQRLLGLEGASRAQMQKGFWKTRRTQSDDQKDDDSGVRKNDGKDAESSEK